MYRTALPHRLWPVGRLDTTDRTVHRRGTGVGAWWSVPLVNRLLDETSTLSLTSLQEVVR